MSTDSEDTPTSRGAEYRHPDGTIEVVFETSGDRVLSVREYPSRASFTDALAAAEFTGVNDAVATLPGIDVFAEESAPAEDADGPS